MNLSSLSLSKLHEIERDLPGAIKAAKARDHAKMREALDHALNGSGFTLADFIEGKRSRLKASKVAPKYRDKKTGKTWTGRGRTPLWMPKSKKDREAYAI
jgi:DNA-binding protein H-NS